MRSRRSRVLTGLIAVAGLLSLAAAPAAPVIYPAKGQSAKKQSSDRSHCDHWAIQQTGYDPAVAQPPPKESGRILKGGLGGGAVGGIIGSLSGNAGKGAAIGAVAGGTIGGVQQHNKNEAAQARQDQNLEGYYRAFGACMSGRGYTVR